MTGVNANESPVVAMTGFLSSSSSCSRSAAASFAEILGKSTVCSSLSSNSSFLTVIGLLLRYELFLLRAFRSEEEGGGGKSGER